MSDGSLYLFYYVMGSLKFESITMLLLIFFSLYFVILF